MNDEDLPFCYLMLRTAFRKAKKDSGPEVLCDYQLRHLHMHVQGPIDGLRWVAASNVETPHAELFYMDPYRKGTVISEAEFDELTIIKRDGHYVLMDKDSMAKEVDESVDVDDDNPDEPLIVTIMKRKLAAGAHIEFSDGVTIEHIDFHPEDWHSWAHYEFWYSYPGSAPSYRPELIEPRELGDITLYHYELVKEPDQLNSWIFQPSKAKVAAAKAAKLKEDIDDPDEPILIELANRAIDAGKTVLIDFYDKKSNWDHKGTVIKLFPTTTRAGVYVITYMATNESLPDMLELTGAEMEDQLTLAKNHNGVLTLKNSKKVNDPSWDEEQVDEAIDEDPDAPLICDLISNAMDRKIPIYFFDHEYMHNPEALIGFEKERPDSYRFIMGANAQHDGRQIIYGTEYIEKMKISKKPNRLLVTYD
jgi:hypothetical protein